jgi:hypothetical protein
MEFDSSNTNERITEVQISKKKAGINISDQIVTRV